MTLYRYDPEHALMLCRLHTFKDGMIFLYDKMRLYREVLQVCKKMRLYGDRCCRCVKR
jgi:hypothetical protein